MTTQFPPAPVFGMPTNGDGSTRNGIISLVDIFDDFLFANDRSAVNTTSSAGAAAGKDDYDDDDYDDDDDLSGDDSEEGKRRKRPRTSHRSMTDEQKVERR